MVAQHLKYIFIVAVSWNVEVFPQLISFRPLKPLKEAAWQNVYFSWKRDSEFVYYNTYLDGFSLIMFN